jgi:hypothetical protein
MVTTSELYKLPGAIGKVLKYDNDAYYLDSAGVVFRVPPEVFNALKVGAQLIPDGGVFEMSSEELKDLFLSEWETSSLHRELYRAEVRAEVILCGQKLFYVKKSFTEDFPDGKYTFASDCGLGLYMVVANGKISSYSECEVTTDNLKHTKLAYIHSFDGVSYTPLWQVTTCA